MSEERQRMSSDDISEHPFSLENIPFFASHIKQAQISSWIRGAKCWMLNSYLGDTQNGDTRQTHRGVYRVAPQLKVIMKDIMLKVRLGFFNIDFSPLVFHYNHYAKSNLRSTIVFKFVSKLILFNRLTQSSSQCYCPKSRRNLALFHYSVWLTHQI